MFLVLWNAAHMLSFLYWPKMCIVLMRFGNHNFTRSKRLSSVHFVPLSATRNLIATQCLVWWAEEMFRNEAPAGHCLSSGTGPAQQNPRHLDKTRYCCSVFIVMCSSNLIQLIFFLIPTIILIIGNLHLPCFVWYCSLKHRHSTHTLQTFLLTTPWAKRF